MYLKLMWKSMWAMYMCYWSG